MDSVIRLSAAVNKVHCGNPLDCLEEIRQMLKNMPACDIAVFPKLSLLGSCGSLALNSAVTGQCSDALDICAEITREMDSYVLAGLCADDWGKPVSVMALLYKGELIAYIPTVDNLPPFANDGFSEELVPANTVFACGDMRFCVMGCKLSDIPLRAAKIAETGCDLIIIPAYEPMYAGKYEDVRKSAEVLSKAAGVAVVVVNGGVGDTSSPWMFDGFMSVYECGTELAGAKAGYESFSCTVDLDLDIIRSQKKYHAYERPSHAVQPVGHKRGLLRQVNPNPFLPAENVPAYLDELFGLQVRSLVARMENIGISRLVLGISGGLDSTVALLVSAAAVDTLGLPRENIVAICMPGFGTSDRTYFNALSLIEKLGATMRDISIRRSVSQHFEDIGHSGKKDTAYENAQARERAQILLDVANMVGGIVVGTGDLSESALGFCTFAGDHIANYNVNSCITKTVLRSLAAHIAENGVIEGISDIVADILETPVSPELLPPEENGGAGQITEDILAPYELLDFFIYYFVKYRFRPSKIYVYACIAFSGKYRPDYVKTKLQMFLQRFCAGQFKRACAPDSAAITEVNLSNASFYIPSDLDSAGLLRELEDIE